MKQRRRDASAPAHRDPSMGACEAQPSSTVPFCPGVGSPRALGTPTLAAAETLRIHRSSAPAERAKPAPKASAPGGWDLAVGSFRSDLAWSLRPRSATGEGRHLPQGPVPSPGMWHHLPQGPQTSVVEEGTPTGPPSVRTPRTGMHRSFYPWAWAAPALCRAPPAPSVRERSLTARGALASCWRK